MPLRRLFRKYREHTMIPKFRYVSNLELASRYRGIPGCVVECGVWRGGMSAGLAELMGHERDYFLFDSFEGLPPASEELDGNLAAAWQRPENLLNFRNCTASMNDADEAMRMSGARRYKLVKGWFKDTLPGFKPPDKIAILRLDGDWYESTMVCLDHLFPHLADNALVIVDDYYAWEGCTRAVNEFVSRSRHQGVVLRLKQFDNDVCYFERRTFPEWTPEVELSRDLQEARSGTR
jgi:O-methyltransferase